MAGTLAIPFTFKTMVPPQSDVGNLDTDLTTIRDYINNREITSGLGANRPAPGVAGRFWFSTDVSGGALYFDNGASWVSIAVGVGQAGAARVVGLVGANNAVTPNTKFDLAADSVTLRNPTTGATSTIANTGTLTCDIGAAGPVVNGRDQAAAFGASSWVHFYFIYDGVTLATLASATAPPTGPTLPGAYTLWAYCGAVRNNATPLLVKTRLRGAQAGYDARQSLAVNQLNITETTFDASALVPPNALRIHGHVFFRSTVATGAGGGGEHEVALRIVSGSTYVIPASHQTALVGELLSQYGAFTLPNVGQAFIALLAQTGAPNDSDQYDLFINGYTMPNGDS